MRSMRFLGEGPYRVWKNRLKGGVLDVWSNKYKNDVPGVTWDFPEFKGYYRDWRWVVFTTEEGEITIVNETPELFLGVYTAERRSGPREHEAQSSRDRHCAAARHPGHRHEIRQAGSARAGKPEEQGRRNVSRHGLVPFRC